MTCMLATAHVRSFSTPYNYSDEHIAIGASTIRTTPTERIIVPSQPSLHCRVFLNEVMAKYTRKSDHFGLKPGIGCSTIKRVT